MKPARDLPRKRVTMGQFRRMLRRTKPSAGAPSGLAAKRTSPPPPGRPGSFSAGDAGQAKDGVTCMGHKYYPCWCSGEATCNAFIAACVELGGHLYCGEHGSEGRPTGCSCYK